MTSLLLRSKIYALLPWAKPPPLKSYTPLSLHLQSGGGEEEQCNSNNNKLIQPTLPFIYSHSSSESHQTLTGQSMKQNSRNVSARSYATRRSAKKMSRLVDEVEEESIQNKEESEEEDDDDDDDEEWSGEITEEMLRCKDNDEEEDCWEEDEEEVEARIGDGEDGGGVVLGDTSWGSKALTTAEEVLLPFKEDLRIYAFKASHRGYIYVRLDKLSDKYGCPSIDDIKKFHSLYAERLEEVGQAGGVPDNLAIEVSSPGAERFVRVPEDLERFKGLPVYVSYVEDTTEDEAKSKEQD
ncbi:hypothetical protein KI387_032652, partial [Taxus chinensis]